MNKEILLTPGQEKTLKKLVVLPRIALFSLIAFALLTAIFLLLEMILGAFLDADNEVNRMIFWIIMICLVLAVFLYAIISTVLHVRNTDFQKLLNAPDMTEIQHASDTYRLIRSMNNLLGSKSMDSDEIISGGILIYQILKYANAISRSARAICLENNISCSAGFARLFLIVPIAVFMLSYVPVFTGAVGDLNERVEKVSAVQDEIADEYEGICSWINKEDVAEYKSSETFTLAMSSKEGYDSVAGISYTIRKTGKIKNYYMVYYFDNDKSLEENLEAAGQYFGIYSEPIESIENLFENSDLAQYRYQISDEFAQMLTDAGSEEALDNSFVINPGDNEITVIESYTNYSGDRSMMVSFHCR